MRARVLAHALVVGALLVIALNPPVEAQRGLGRGRGRQPEPAPSKEQTKDPQTNKDRQTPKEELGPGEYSFEGFLVLEAVNRGEGPQALAYYEKTAQEAEGQGDQLRAARALGAAATVAQRLGRYQKSIQYGTRSLELYKSAKDPTQADLMSWAAVHAQLGSAYRAVGDQTRARQVLEEGLQFANTRLSGRREGQVEGYLLNGLAMVAYNQHDYQTALARNTQAAQYFEDWEAHVPRRASERLRASVRRWYAMALYGVGRAQLALKHPDEADAAFDRSLKYARSTGLHEIEIDILGGQANLAVARKDWAKAAGLYQQGIVLARQIKRVGGLPNLYNGLARSYAELGRTDDALAASREAVRHIEDVRAELSDSELRSGYFEGKQGIYEGAVYLALQAQHPDEAFDLAERGRSRTFLDLLGSQTTLSKGRTRALVDEEVRLRARLAEAQAQAQAQDSGEESDRARAQIEALDRDYRAFLVRVRKESLEQASLMAVEPVTLAEIQALLPEGTTLLEYLVSESGVVLWVVDRQRATVVPLPGDRQSLIAQVRRFRGAISKPAPIADVQSQARALYRRLLEPARKEIRGDRVVIVPHGVLHYLPFVALRTSSGRWMVEDFSVSTLPSASVLRYLAEKGTGASSRALVVGNPDLGAELALPWAEREARMVGQREKDATVLVRADATELHVKKLLETAGVVHLATHGELSEDDPLSSAVLLVPGGGEDGRLEVREVFGLDMHARLVVLSACETGLGKLTRGDELVGLQRAFLYAGTPAVVTTLWKVDDKATFELVRSFYTRLEGGAGPVEALRQAQIEAMRAFPHPYAWAAFGLSGLPR
jgi:CHAT domain-containing protein